MNNAFAAVPTTRFALCFLFQINSIFLHDITYVSISMKHVYQNAYKERLERCYKSVSDKEIIPNFLELEDSTKNFPL